MDRTYIESQQIVRRYLSGDLTVREAREFEKYCLEHPDVLNSLPIPVRVKAKMARHPGAELDANDFSSMPSTVAIEAAGLDDGDDDDDEPSSSTARGVSSGRGWTTILGVAFAIAVAGVVALYFRANALEKQLAATQRTAKSLQLHAPATMQEYRVRPLATPPASPTVSASASNAQLMELRIDMSEGKYNTFLVTIDSVSSGRVMLIRRVARDSNGEMRIGLNSSAFGAGDYDLKLEGYTWRGDTVPVGWIRLGLN